MHRLGGGKAECGVLEQEVHWQEPRVKEGEARAEAGEESKGGG